MFTIDQIEAAEYEIAYVNPPRGSWTDNAIECSLIVETVNRLLMKGTNRVFIQDGMVRVQSNDGIRYYLYLRPEVNA